MANKLHSLLPPLLETGLGFPKTPTLSISVAKRVFSSISRPDSQEEVTDQLPSLSPNQPTENGIKLNDSKIEEEEHDEEDEDEENSVYVNEKTGEISGPRGPEPTRYGDWERNGRCSDF